MGNIFGEGFPPQIDAQVRIRQKAYGSGYASSRSVDNIQFLNTNTSWCKLVSGVNVNQDNGIWAKTYVLFNGLNADGTQQRSGVGGGNGAYGLGGTQYSGFAPMPGIVSAQIQHQNKGSLRTAEVKIKAFNKDQFKIVDVLYLRLGFSMLLEWGHSMYYNNGGVLVKNANNSLATSFLNGNKTYSQFLTSIQQQRLNTNGNYDAMFARVSNFDWTIDKVGVYDITVKLISIGDVIESLKVNSSMPAEQVSLDDLEITEEQKQQSNYIIAAYSKANAIGAWLAKGNDISNNVNDLIQQDKAIVDVYGKDGLNLKLSEEEKLTIKNQAKIKNIVESGTFIGESGITKPGIGNKL